MNTPIIKHQTSRWQRIAPIVTLLLLAPIVSEVLSGSTRISTIFALIPEIAVWGCGTLIIRYLARRWRKDWISIFLMGLALSIAEECVVQQTSLAPLVGIDPAHVYSRALGVNWLYLLWQLVYESVWVVVVPIQLAELIFPERQDAPWVGTRGFVIALVFFALGSFNAWYFWTQLFVPQFSPESAYTPPFATIAIAVIAIIALVSIALTRQSYQGSERSIVELAPRPWTVGGFTFAIGLMWFLLFPIAYGAMPTLPVAIPVGIALFIVVLTYLRIASWAGSSGWQAAHRLALVIGIVLATGLGGFIVLTMNVVFTMSNALLIDRIGQIVFNIVAILLLILLARRPQFYRK